MWNAKRQNAAQALADAVANWRSARDQEEGAVEGEEDAAADDAETANNALVEAHDAYLAAQAEEGTTSTEGTEPQA